MGFKTFGFAGGRADQWEPEELYWGPEGTWLGDERYSGERELAGPLGAVQMGLIYVNPEGPNGKPDPVAAAKDIRETFARMAMNDEETVALIAGGHTFGKAHGAGDPSLIGPEPEGGAIEDQGLGWKSKHGTGIGADAITGGPEVTWSQTPTKWSNHFFDNLFKFEWELTKSPAGAQQWKAKNAEATIPDAFDKSKKHVPTMLTTDLSLRMDPAYEKISRRFYEHPRAVRRRVRARLVQAHASRHGADPALPRPARAEGDADLAGPDPRGRPSADRRRGRRGAQGEDPGVWPLGLRAGLDGVGVGVDLPRLRQARRRQRRAHSPRARRRTGRSTSRPSSKTVLGKLEAIQKEFSASGKKVSLADLIVLGGNAAVEKAAKDAGLDVKVPFTPGRMDASQEQTDVALLRAARAARRRLPQLRQRQGVHGARGSAGRSRAAADPDGAGDDGAGGRPARARRQCREIQARCLHRQAGDAEQRLLRQPARHGHGVAARRTGRRVRRPRPQDQEGQVDRHARRPDLRLASPLRALAEAYGTADAKEKFAKDFAAAWTKVMNLDRYDVAA